MLTSMTPSKCRILLGYQILSNLGWVQFFNGVGVTTQKELSLEILIYWHRSLMKGCHASHSALKIKSNSFLMDMLENYSVTRRKPRSKLMSKKIC